MKIFPHGFVPFLRVNVEKGFLTAVSHEQTPQGAFEKERAAGTDLIKIDVENAVSVILARHEIKNESLRQKARIEVIKRLPSESIDWDTVNWVQLCPFQTARM